MIAESGIPHKVYFDKKLKLHYVNISKGKTKSGNPKKVKVYLKKSSIAKYCKTKTLNFSETGAKLQGEARKTDVVADPYPALTALTRFRNRPLVISGPESISPGQSFVPEKTKTPDFTETPNFTETPGSETKVPEELKIPEELKKPEEPENSNEMELIWAKLKNLSEEMSNVYASTRQESTGEGERQSGKKYLVSPEIWSKIFGKFEILSKLANDSIAAKKNLEKAVDRSFGAAKLLKKELTNLYNPRHLRDMDIPYPHKTFDMYRSARDIAERIVNSLEVLKNELAVQRGGNSKPSFPVELGLAQRAVDVIKNLKSETGRKGFDKDLKEAKRNLKLIKKGITDEWTENVGFNMTDFQRSVKMSYRELGLDETAKEAILTSKQIEKEVWGTVDKGIKSTLEEPSESIPEDFVKPINPLSTTEIENIMGEMMSRLAKRGFLKKDSKFLGVGPVNETSEIWDKGEQKIRGHQGMIINLDDGSEPGSHWIAIFFTEDTIEIYDSFGRPLRELKNYPVLAVGLKHISDESEEYMRLKVNRIRDQNYQTESCGYHCIRFLINRFSGVPFRECTGFDPQGESKNAEFWEKLKFPDSLTKLP